ncbi:uncharacterized protein LOC142344417 [Convolutriloba macropyga]|uniref:uncharacterized protein LOC142344417 n=1 Tax=Convolutriloba macropyga TaxID=536237 RepID=UPI003F51D167
MRMKPEKFLVRCIMATVIWSSVLVEADYGLAVLHNYAERKFYVFYNGESAPSESEFQLQSASALLEYGYFDLGNDSSTQNDTIECPTYADGNDPVQSLFKLCIATLKSLDDSVWLTNTDVRVNFRKKSSVFTATANFKGDFGSAGTTGFLGLVGIRTLSALVTLEWMDETALESSAIFLCFFFLFSSNFFLASLAC